jgi:hypothetical protein
MGGESSDSMLPEFLTEECVGFPLWQYLLILLLVLVAVYWARSKGYLDKPKDTGVDDKPVGAYYY